MKTKEEYLVTIIRNNIRKNNFLELNYLLETNQITEDEFEETLKKEDKYCITINHFSDEDNIMLINNIVHELYKDLGETDYSEVSEMFGISQGDLINEFNKFL